MCDVAVGGIYFTGWGTDPVITVSHGWPFSADATRPTKRALVEAAQTIVLVSDSTKFSRKSRFRVCPLHRITTMLTDGDIAHEHRRMMEAAGVRVVAAPVGDEG